VLLESGQTFAIGGLIQTQVQAASNKVPVLGDLPFVGVGFSNLTYQTRESELVILVTPRLVEAMDPCQAPKRLPGMETRTPDDYELFLENILEAPRGQRKVWNGKCYNAAYKCDPTIGKYPCAGNVCTGPNGTCLPAPAFGSPYHGVTGSAHPAGTGVTGAPTPMPETPVALPPIPTPIQGAPVGGGAEPMILPPPPR
jgi:pilus assembly protein CpaC